MIDPKDDPRKLIVDAISTRIFAAKRFAIDEIMRACGKYDYHQSGLYILYDDIDTILYVGQIQHEKDSSLRKRIQEHNRVDYWFDKVRFVRFRPFPYLCQGQLDIAERLLIMNSGQPPYNDKNTSVEKLDEYNWSAEMLSDR